MKYSLSRQIEIDTLIHAEMVYNRKASAGQISKKLGYNIDFVYLRMKKIRRSMIENIRLETIEGHLARFKEQIERMNVQLWEMVNDKLTDKSDRVAAMKLITQNEKDLFDKLFDAGIFQRQLGELEVGGAAKNAIGAFAEAFMAKKDAKKDETNNTNAESKDESVGAGTN